MSQLTKIHVFSFHYDIMNPDFVKEKIRRLTPPHFILLLAERLAVGALILSGIHLMGAHQNTLQGAEVCVLAVMLALLNSTFNALICMTIHKYVPPFLRDGLRFPRSTENIHFILR